jgi:hypothetical protein
MQKYATLPVMERLKSKSSSKQGKMGFVSFIGFEEDSRIAQYKSLITETLQEEKTSDPAFSKSQTDIEFIDIPDHISTNDLSVYKGGEIVVVHISKFTESSTWSSQVQSLLDANAGPSATSTLILVLFDEEVMTNNELVESVKETMNQVISNSAVFRSQVTTIAHYFPLTTTISQPATTMTLPPSIENLLRTEGKKFLLQSKSLQLLTSTTRPSVKSSPISASATNTPAAEQQEVNALEQANLLAKSFQADLTNAFAAYFSPSNNNWMFSTDLNETSRQMTSLLNKVSTTHYQTNRPTFEEYQSCRYFSFAGQMTRRHVLRLAMQLNTLVQQRFETRMISGFQNFLDNLMKYDEEKQGRFGGDISSLIDSQIKDYMTLFDDMTKKWSAGKYCFLTYFVIF